MNVKDLPIAKIISRQAPGMCLTGANVEFECSDDGTARVYTITQNNTKKLLIFDKNGKNLKYLKFPEKETFFLKDENMFIDLDIFTYPGINRLYRAEKQLFYEKDGLMYLYKIPIKPMTLWNDHWVGQHGIGGQRWKALKEFTLTPKKEVGVAVIAKIGDKFPYYSTGEKVRWQALLPDENINW